MQIRVLKNFAFVTREWPHLRRIHAARPAMALDDLREGVVVQGLADDLDAAKAAFKTNWETLLAAGTA